MVENNKTQKSKSLFLVHWITLIIKYKMKFAVNSVTKTFKWIIKN